MSVTDLRNKFIAVRKQEPLDDFELLQFAKMSYVRGDLTIIEYRDLVKVLDNENTYNPEGKVKEYPSYS